jgi:hypothetical protein
MKREVSTAEVITAALDARMGDVHTAMVGRVESVNLAARKVDVRPSMARVLRDAEGRLSTELLPVLPQVPLGALRAGSARIDMPVQPGHWVVVLFFEDNVGKWLTAGGVGVSPGDVERHGLTGAVAIPMLYPDTERPAEPLDPLNVVVRSGAGQVLLGGTSGHDFVALAAKVDAELARIRQDFLHLHTAILAGFAGLNSAAVPAGAATAFNTSIAAPATLTPTQPGTVAATKVKAT